MKNILIVGMGGFLGASFRYTLGLIPIRSSFFELGLGTIFSNAVGCFIFGFFIHYISQKDNWHEEYKLFILAGICGGITTFSSLIYEFLQYYRGGEITKAWGYLAINFILGISLYYTANMLSKSVF